MNTSRIYHGGSPLKSYFSFFNPGSVSPDVGKVYCTAGDTDIDYLKLSIDDGEGILTVITNPGGAEKVQIICLGQSNVSSLDTTIDYLENKIVGQAPIVVTKLNPSGNEQIQIGIDGSTDNDKVAVTGNDTTPDYLQNKLAAGSNITFTLLNPAGDEELEISAAGASGGGETLIFSNAGALALNTLIDAPNFGPFPAYGQGYHVTVAKRVIAINALCNRWTAYANDTINFQLRYTSETRSSSVSGTTGTGLTSFPVSLVNTGGAFRYYGGGGVTGLTDNIPAGNFLFCRCSGKTANSVTGVTIKAVLEDQ